MLKVELCVRDEYTRLISSQSNYKFTRLDLSPKRKTKHRSEVQS